MADVAGIPASSGTMQARSGSDAVAGASPESTAAAFKATDYAALLSALGEAGRFEARSGGGGGASAAASPLLRARREQAPSAAILRERLLGEVAAASAAEAAVPSPGKVTRRPGPIATMVIAYLALVAASGGTIFYLWGGEHAASLTSIGAAVQRFRATVADAVATRLPASGGDDAAAVPPSASVAIREITAVPAAAPVAAPSEPVLPSAPAARPSAAAESPTVQRPPAPPVAVAAPVTPSAEPAHAAAPVVAPSALVEPAGEEEEPVAISVQPAGESSPPVPRSAPVPAPAAPAKIAPARAAAPPVTAAPVPPAPPAVPPAEIARLLKRGDELLATGDIAAARLFYGRAADAGSSRAATAVGKTYDPAFLKQAGVRGGGGADAAKAAQWYRRADAAGDAEASARLKALRAGTAR